MVRKKESHFVHIGIEHAKAVSAKRDMLLCERILLETIKTMREYNSSRRQETIVKSSIKKDFSIIHFEISKILREFPKPEDIEIREIIKQRKIQLNEAGKTEEPELNLEELRQMQTKEIAREGQILKSRKKNHEIERELAEIKFKLAGLT